MNHRSTIENAVRAIAPRIPRHELAAVVDHAIDSKSLRSISADDAAWLSLVAYVRHVFTDYDQLLASGYDVDSARHFVVEEINGTLVSWGVYRRV